MRIKTLALLLLLAVLPVTAKEANLTFEPGKSLGSAVLGQSPEAMLKAFEGWTYEIEPYAIGDLYHFPKGEPGQFKCSFSKDHRLNGFSVLGDAIRMNGVVSIGPGCSKEEVLKQFGKPSTDTLDEFGGYWDYDSRGICFHFPASPEKQRDPPRYGAGRVESISIYAPGTSRFKR